MVIISLKSHKERISKRRWSYFLLPLCVTLLVLIPYTSTDTLENLKSMTAGTTSTTILSSGTVGTTPYEEVGRGGPFPMPIQGENYRIFQPLYDMDSSLKDEPLMSHPKHFLSNFDNRLNWVNTMITNPPQEQTTQEYAKFMYLEMMKLFISGLIFDAAEHSVAPKLNIPHNQLLDLNRKHRMRGVDWAYLGDSMIGSAGLDNIRDLVSSVVQNKIEGDYIETGVWRGGASVFARAVVTMLGEEEKRVSYVCDSFAGLPPGEKHLDKSDVNWDNTPYLEVSNDIVANNFIKFGLLDSNVVFAKGFFNETMPPLSKRIEKLSIMRLDGDMYESTVDVLYHLYDKLSIGGFVIMDDWNHFPSKTACEDFFKVHGINPEIVFVDADGFKSYWQKTQEIDIQFWRYEQSKFKVEDKMIVA